MASGGLLLNDLPVEVLEHIFSFLPLSNRKTASLVCHKWNEIAFNGRFLRNVTLKFTVTYSGPEWKDTALQSSRRRYRNVSFRPSVPRPFGFIIQFLDLFGADLEYFHCTIELTDSHLRSVIARAPNLQQLDIKLDSQFVSEQPLSVPELKYLRVDGVLSHLQGLDAPNLTQLSVVSDVDAQSNEVLKRLTPQLESLELRSHSSRGFVFPFDKLSFVSLTVLEIYFNMDAASIRRLITFLRGFNTLKDVFLVCNITNIVLDAMTSAHPQIEMLSFIHCELNAESFRLLERLKCLKFLSLNGQIDSQSSPERIPLIRATVKPLVNVKTLYLALSGMSSLDIRALRQLLPNVIAMELYLWEDFGPDPTQNMVDNFCASFSHLKRLAIVTSYHCRLRGALSHQDRLEELRIDCPTIGKSDFMLPNEHLKRLEIRTNTLITDKDLLTFAEMYPNLKHLKINSLSQRISFMGEKAFQSHLPGCVLQLQLPTRYDNPSSLFPLRFDDTMDRPYENQNRIQVTRNPYEQCDSNGRLLQRNTY